MEKQKEETKKVFTEKGEYEKDLLDREIPDEKMEYSSKFESGD